MLWSVWFSAGELTLRGFRDEPARASKRAAFWVASRYRGF